MTASNATSASGDASSSSENGENSAGAPPQQFTSVTSVSSAMNTSALRPPAKKKRNLAGRPDPDAEVIALSPKTLMATNRFVCEICGKGFQRDQNLQLHRRGHNLPWKLRQRTSNEPRKRVYICPEPSCLHHDPSRALGDLTGIKKHFCRKHGEKKWKCDKCNKRYAVQSDWKAHSKTCGTRLYRCDCGTFFTRRDSFTTHRAFCDALAEECGKPTEGAPGIRLMSNTFDRGLDACPTRGDINSTGGSDSSPGFFTIHMPAIPSDPAFLAATRGLHSSIGVNSGTQNSPSFLSWARGGTASTSNLPDAAAPKLSLWSEPGILSAKRNDEQGGVTGIVGKLDHSLLSPSFTGLSSTISKDTSPFATVQKSATQMSATALLQKAAQMGSTSSTFPSVKGFPFCGLDSSSSHLMKFWQGRGQDQGTTPDRLMASAGLDQHQQSQTQLCGSYALLPEATKHLESSTVAANVDSTDQSLNRKESTITSTSGYATLFGDGLTTFPPISASQLRKKGPSQSRRGSGSIRVSTGDCIADKDPSLLSGSSEALCKDEDGVEKVTLDFFREK